MNTLIIIYSYITFISFSYKISDINIMDEREEEKIFLH